MDKKSINLDWKWQIRNSLKSLHDFEEVFELTPDEKEGFLKGADLFNIQVTPYYASLSSKMDPHDPLRKMIMPNGLELDESIGFQRDPLGENAHRPVSRIIHRYADRVLFLVTDFCGIYCRYCTRKHFTGGGKSFPLRDEYTDSIEYIRENSSIREVILSGGDPLTLSDQKLEKIFSDLESIDHVELIRLGSRMPAACPMRLTQELAAIISSSSKNIVLMAHFNHPREVSEITEQHLRNFTNQGIQIFNQMVLLNGINNHPAIVYGLSRKLLRNKVYPYYMFQCDPSPGTGHLRTSIEESLEIQRALWGRASGLAMPTLSVDIPSGGGKAYLTPDFIVSKTERTTEFQGFDGVRAEYENPPAESRLTPLLDSMDLELWNSLS